jgi:hypothetical protein
MYAITIWQPWASMIMAGFKPYEFRGWPLPKRLIGQRVVIHAGSRPVRGAECHRLYAEICAGEQISLTGAEALLEFVDRASIRPHRLPVAAGLGTALLGAPKLASEIWPEAFKSDSDRLEHSNWAWPLSEIQHFTPIVPTPGRQGFWKWPWSGAAQ